MYFFFGLRIDHVIQWICLSWAQAASPNLFLLMEQKKIFLATKIFNTSDREQPTSLTTLSGFPSWRSLTIFLLTVSIDSSLLAVVFPFNEPSPWYVTCLYLFQIYKLQNNSIFFSLKKIPFTFKYMLFIYVRCVSPRQNVQLQSVICVVAVK